MGGTGMLIQGAFVKPPISQTEDTLSASASAAQDLGTTLRKDCMISFIADAAFNLTFSETSTVTDPTAVGYFAAGTVYSFAVGSKNRYFKHRGTGAGNIMWWRSTYA